MKLAKFVYPMFLVAIGLHGLLLFVPVGETSEAELIEEDVELSELPTTAASKAKAALREPAGPLPVPNLNLATGAPAPAKPAAAVTTAVRSAAATPRSAVRQPAAATGTTSSARTTPATPAAVSPAAGRLSQRGAGTIASSGASSVVSGSASTSSSSTESHRAPRPNLPNLSAVSSGSATEENSAGSGRNAGGPLSLSGLIASVTNSAPEALDSLRSDFVEDYTYADKNTDAAGLEDRRSRWIDKISLLANADGSAIGGSAGAEKVEPIVLSDSKLSYPIELSARSDRRASRICLEDPRPNDAEVAVLFDAQGNVVGLPEMTRSSGYPAIDREIIAIVTAAGGALAADSAGFSETRQAKAYLQAFEIDYAADRCLTLPKLRK